MNALNLKVNKSTKINGKELTSDIYLDKFDFKLANVEDLSITDAMDQINSTISSLNQSTQTLLLSLHDKADKKTTVNGTTLNSNIILGLSSSNQQQLSQIENTYNKNTPNGYAGLDSNGLIPANRLAINGLTYLGVWDAFTNTPSLLTVPAAGSYYVVNVAGNTTLTGGTNNWRVHDWAISNGYKWIRIVNSESISSVNAKTDNITITKNDLSLQNIDNTSDLSKPISTPQQSALDNKVSNITTINSYPLSSDVILSKDDFALSNIDNIPDLLKLNSSSFNSALSLKEDLTNKNIPLGYAGLDSNSKLSVSQIPINGLYFAGNWNAYTNTPTLTSGIGVTGTYYIVTVSGSTLLDSFNTWTVNDWAIFNGSFWQKIDNNNLITSVNSLQGAVLIDKTSIALSNADNTADINKPISTLTQSSLNLKQSTSEKGTPNGYASLDSSTQLLSSQLPSIAVSSLNDVSISTPLNTQVLTYDSTLSKWKNATVTSGGGGGSLGTTGNGDSYVSTNFGVGTTTVNAALDVESSLLQTASFSTTFGVSSCQVNSYGYPQVISVFQNTINVSSHNIVANSTTYNIPSSTFTNMQAPLYYVYSEANSLSTHLSFLPPESPTISYLNLYPASYINFESGYDDPYNNVWYTDSASTISMDTTRSKFGTKSFLINNNSKILWSSFSTKTCVDTCSRLYLPGLPQWAITAWVYVSSYPSGGTTWLLNYELKSGSFPNSYGFFFGLQPSGQLQLWFSTSGSGWDINGQNITTLPLNTWTQIGLAFSNTNGQILLKANAGYTNTSISRGMFNSTSPQTFFTSIGFTSATAHNFNIDEIIMTPYYRDPSVPDTAAFAPDTTIKGTPFASYLNGSSASPVDGYSSIIKWYGSYLTGSNFPGSNPSMQFTNTRSVYAPMCPNLNKYPEWTIEFWFQVISGTTAYLFDTRMSEAETGIVLKVTASNQLTLYLAASTSGYSIFNGATISTPGLNSINYFVLTYSSSRGGYRAYLNSAQVLSNTSTAPVVCPSMIGLCNSTSAFAPSSFVINMNDFRISPYLVYGPSGPTSNPTTLLGINTARDLIDPISGACTTQGLNASTSNIRVYLGTARIDLGLARHWFPSTANHKPLCKFNNYKLYTDAEVASPKLSFSLPVNVEAGPRSFMTLLRSDGRLYVGGDPGMGDGALGISVSNGTSDMYFPIITLQKKIKKIYAGLQKYVCVDYDNIVWGCGANSSGSLGIGTTSLQTTLVPIFTTSIAEPLIFMSPAYSYSSLSDCIFILDSGNMYSAGTNSSGQLGLGNTTQQNTFTLVPKISSQNWAYVWQHQQQTFAITDASSGNKLYACGNNGSQSLGVAQNGGNVNTFTACQYIDGTPVTNVKWVVSTSSSNDANVNTFVLLNTGEVYVTGRNSSATNKLPAVGCWIGFSINLFGFVGPIIRDVSKMYSSGDNANSCTLFIRTDGSLWSADVLLTVLNPYTTSVYPMTCLELFWTNGEKFSISKVISSHACASTGLCIITTDGTAVLAGSMNSNNNALAGNVPLNSQLISRNSASNIYLTEPIVDARLSYNYDSSTIASYTFLQTFTGKIYVCGSSTIALAGSRNLNKLTFVQLNIL